jgi:predicted porin
MVMIGGIMKTTSRLALVAAAGVLLGAAITPAKAADLGGGCCGDLEERVAELEATTARKGNRVVSLQVYGQVNKSLLIWDDGVDSDAFIVDNESSGSRLGFTGKATIKPGWTAGFLMEFDVQDEQSSGVSQLSDEDPAEDIIIRHNNFWIESERLGRITVGQASTAADGAYQVSLGNTLTNAAPDVGASFNIRTSDGGGLGEFRLSDFVSDFDAPRDDVVRYDSPSIYGFILSTSWGDDDYSDVALRFKKEFNSVRVAAAVAYQWDSRSANRDIEILGGSASAMHIPTGLFVSVMAAEREIDGNDAGNFVYVQGGIEKKFLPYGATTVYVDYGRYEDIGNVVLLDDGVEVASLSDTEADRFGFGIVQKIDSAAMELYAQAYFYSFEGTTTGIADDDFEDLSLFMVGSRIKF